MKSLVCLSPGNLAVEDRLSPPPPAPGWVTLDVKAVGICGTDYHIYEGKHPFLNYPRVMGHELSGVVRAAGSGVDLAIGTRVIVNPYISCGRCHACQRSKPNCCMAIEVLGVHRDGGMCEAINIPATNLYPAGDLSFRDAAMVEFLAIGAHAVRRAKAQKGDSALVVGIGPIGLGAAVFARLAGLDVTLLDASPERLAFARDELGFAVAEPLNANSAHALLNLTGGDGFDIVFDATGNVAAIEAGFTLVAHGGSYVLISVVKDTIRFADPEFHKREMTLIGSRNATKADFEHVIKAIAAGDVPLQKLATHSATLDALPQAMALWAHDKTGLIKALIDV